MASDVDMMRNGAKSLYILHSERAPGEYVERVAALWSQDIEILNTDGLDQLSAGPDPPPSQRRWDDVFAVMVLCGGNTAQNCRIDREIALALTEGLPVVGVKLPSLPLFEGGCAKPRQLQFAINSDRAAWVWWEELCVSQATLRRCLGLAVALPEQAHR
jgi:hypothetical protein